MFFEPGVDFAAAEAPVLADLGRGDLSPLRQEVERRPREFEVFLNFYYGKDFVCHISPLSFTVIVNF